uniref:Zinc finger C2HC-type containing 1B n=1 Tax=Strigops habroptila TaxID=2489341 RepID=A0A672UFC9_STRHB
MLKSETLLNLKTSIAVRRGSSTDSAPGTYLPNIPLCFQLQVLPLVLLSCWVMCAGKQLHDPICRKVFNKKRKPFSSMQQRLQGTEIMTVRKQHPQKKQPEKKSNWRQHHEDFINAIRSAKQATKALKEGRPLPPPPPSSINPDYIQCPHCSRRFNETAAERHIKFCEEQAIRRAFAAKAARPRKPPTTAALPLQRRAQEGASTDEPRTDSSFSNI